MGEPEAFGAALRSYRIRAGMSLAELAKIVHYSKGYLSKVENGVKTPSVDLARQCDVALGAGGALASGAARYRAASGSAPAYGAGTWVLRFDPDGGFSFHVAPDGDGAVAPVPSLRLARPDSPASPATGGSDSYPSLLATYHLLQRLGQEMGPGLVLPTLIAQTHAVSRLAAGDTGPGRRRKTLLAAHYAQ
jgi:transcriptional regulator with XRE-family HTH domain